MIGIVTVLYNSGPVLEDFFITLNKQTYKDFVLYIIDNKSPDNSLEESTRLSKLVDFKCCIMAQEENWGVAKGNNIGITAALNDGCEYVLLSNNDIVLEVDTIEKLLLGLQDEHADMAVPKIYYWNTDRIIWAAGGYFRMYDCSSRHYGMREKDDKSKYNRNSLIEYAPTCFMLINARLFGEIGFMDEDYFVYYDDSDFVWRAVRNFKKNLYFISSSVLWHKESYSTGGCVSLFSLRYLSRNRLYFAFKHYSQFQRIVLYSFILFHYIVRDFFRLSKEQRDAMRKGYAEGYRLSKSKKLF